MKTNIMQLFCSLSLLACALFTSATEAALLLVPNSDTKYENYARHCVNSEEYLCTTDYFISLLKNRKTMQFDKLMDSVDFESKTFANELKKNIVGIINTENLDRMQLAMLIDLLKQADTLYPAPLFKIVENDLLRIKSVLDTAAKAEKYHFSYIFNQKISLEDAKKIKTSILKIPIYVMHFSSVPYKSNTLNFKIEIEKPLLFESCGGSRLTYKIKMLKYCNDIIKE